MKDFEITAETVVKHIIANTNTTLQMRTEGLEDVIKLLKEQHTTAVPHPSAPLSKTNQQQYTTHTHTRKRQ